MVFKLLKSFLITNLCYSIIVSKLCFRYYFSVLLLVLAQWSVLSHLIEGKEKKISAPHVHYFNR